jgi:hypothetical protein
LARDTGAMLKLKWQESVVNPIRKPSGHTATMTPARDECLPMPGSSRSVATQFLEIRGTLSALARC